jgi:hypothetical protein
MRTVHLPSFSLKAYSGQDRPQTTTEMSPITTFSPRFCNKKHRISAFQTQNNHSQNSNKPHNNQELTTNHHNSPQNPKTGFIHSEVVRPQPLTFVSPENYPSAEGATHTSPGQTGVKSPWVPHHPRAGSPTYLFAKPRPIGPRSPLLHRRRVPPIRPRQISLRLILPCLFRRQLLRIRLPRLSIPPAPLNGTPHTSPSADAAAARSSNPTTPPP